MTTPRAARSVAGDDGPRSAQARATASRAPARGRRDVDPCLARRTPDIRNAVATARLLWPSDDCSIRRSRKLTKLGTKGPCRKEQRPPAAHGSESPAAPGTREPKARWCRDERPVGSVSDDPLGG